jgi:hypothetical protein
MGWCDRSILPFTDVQRPEFEAAFAVETRRFENS